MSRIIIFFTAFIFQVKGYCVVPEIPDSATGKFLLVPQIIAIKAGWGYLDHSIDEYYDKAAQDAAIQYWSKYKFLGWQNHTGGAVQTKGRFFLRLGIEYHLGQFSSSMKRFYNDPRVSYSIVTGNSVHDTLLSSSQEPIKLSIFKQNLGFGFYFYKRAAYSFLGLTSSRINVRKGFIYNIYPKKYPMSSIIEVGVDIKQWSFGTYYQSNINQILFFCGYKFDFRKSMTAK